MGTLSVEEYFVLDDLGEVNSEYHDGEVFPVEDLNVWHGIIGANTAWRLVASLRGTPCRAFGAARVCVSRPISSIPT